MFRWKSLAFTLLAISLLSSVSKAPAQVSVDIGVAPVCPYGYYDTLHMIVLRTATMDPTFSWAGYSSGRAHGSTDPEASLVTLITATILAAVTKDRCPSAASRPSTISTRTKLGMGEATSLPRPATRRRKSTAPDIRRENPAADTVKEWFNEVNEEPHFV